MPYLDIYFKALANTLKIVKTNFHAKTKKHLIWDKNAFGLFAGLNFEELLPHLT